MTVGITELPPEGMQLRWRGPGRRRRAGDQDHRGAQPAVHHGGHHGAGPAAADRAAAGVVGPRLGHLPREGAAARRPERGGHGADLGRAVDPLPPAHGHRVPRPGRLPRPGPADLAGALQGIGGCRAPRRRPPPPAATEPDVGTPSPPSDGRSASAGRQPPATAASTGSPPPPPTGAPCRRHRRPARPGPRSPRRRQQPGHRPVPPAGQRQRDHARPADPEPGRRPRPSAHRPPPRRQAPAGGAARTRGPVVHRTHRTSARCRRQLTAQPPAHFGPIQPPPPPQAQAPAGAHSGGAPTTAPGGTTRRSG